MSKGFLEGKLLILAYKHIHLGLSAVLGLNRATCPGNGRIHVITFVTIEGIAYVAFLLHFVLSNQATFSLGGAESQGKTWCNYKFYNHAIRLLLHRLRVI
ncbi:hypothetical protein PENSPDRAFT_694588 [Peniophora sp. CONT]|nr:hypothetical protein PENSPDRAFT_694588 [Peniophora sp. CONT]